MMTQSSPTSPRRPTAFVRQYLNEIVLVIAVVVVIVLTIALTDWNKSAYWQRPGANATEILRQTALLGIFTLGAAVVIISGGIDLSAGSMIAFGGTVCSLVIYVNSPIGPDGVPDTSKISGGVMSLAIGATIVAGFLVGTFHTWLITVIRLPPFVATLASLVGLRSVAKIVTLAVTQQYGNRSVKVNIQDPAFGKLGQEWWIPLIIFLLLSALVWFLLNRTVVGRHLYAMGGNEAAARLSGIRTERLKWLAYCIGATTAAVAGVLYSAEVGSADPQTQGRGYELNAIAAAVVGGCSLQGGVGQIPGVMLGVLFLRVVIDAVAKIIKSGSDDYEGLIVGFLVVLAVAFNEYWRQIGVRRKRFFSGPLGLLAIGILAALIGTVLAVMFGARTGGIAATVTVALLLAVAAVERRRGAA